MMSAMEWGALALWCKKNGWMPWGNNNYGKDTRETMKKGVPAKYESDGRTATILTGTGRWSIHTTSSSTAFTTLTVMYGSGATA